MANTPKKMKDPTEAALSAIQDALHVRDAETPQEQMSSAPAPITAPEEPAADKPWPGLRASQASVAKSDLFDEEVRRPEDIGTMRRPAANDDRESIGQILR